MSWRRRLDQADPGVFDRHICIGARAARPQAEGAGECRLGQPASGEHVARRAGHYAKRREARRPVRERQQPGMRRANKRAENWRDHRLGRGKAERRVPWRLVADHAVGGGDGLVARPPASRQARARRWALRRRRKNSRQGSRLPRGDACLIEVCHVAADDFCHRSAASLQSCVESLRDGKDMRIEAALRDEARRHKCGDGKACRAWRSDAASPRLKSGGAQASATSNRSARKPRMRRAEGIDPHDSNSGRRANQTAIQVTG